MNKTGDGIQMALNAGAQMGPVSFVGHLGTEGKRHQVLKRPLHYFLAALSSLGQLRRQPFRQRRRRLLFSAKRPMPFMHSTAIMPGASLMTLKSNT